MYTGDPYMDTLFMYFPHLLSKGDLLEAVEFRFPTLPNLYKMSREQLLDFYGKHILEVPESKHMINTRGILARAVHSMDVEDPKKDLENKESLYPSDVTEFPIARFGLRFWHDWLPADLKERMERQEKNFRLSKLVVWKNFGRTIGPSTSTGIKRTNSEREETPTSIDENDDVNQPVNGGEGESLHGFKVIAVVSEDEDAEILKYAASVADFLSLLGLDYVDGRYRESGAF